MEIDLNIIVQAVNAANDGMLITDYKLPDNPIVFVNKTFEQITGYKKEDILNRNCRFLQNADRDQIGVKILRNAVNEGKSCRVEIRNYKKDGTLFWNDLSIAPLIGKSGEITHFVGITKEITKLKNLEEALYSEAVHDPLTNLYNRRGFLVEARRAFLLARRSSLNLCLVTMDIDNFKLINDTYGHNIGDQVLVSFAKLLQKNLGKSNILARYGGDEFMGLFFEKEGFNFMSWRSNLLDSFKECLFLPASFSISIGKLFISYTNTKSIVNLIKEVDEEMYKEKIQKKIMLVNI